MIPDRRPLLLGSGSPNVTKVMIMLEEIDMPCHRVWIDVMKGEQREDAFLALNPNAKVPVFVDVVDGRDQVIAESGAILHYLAEQSAMLLGSSVRARTAVLSWLMFQMASVGPMFGQYLHFRFVSRDEPYALHRFTTEMNRIVAVIEGQLGRHRHIAGENYSIADIATFSWIRTMTSFPSDILEKPNMARWYADIAQRPAVARALEYAEEFASRDRERMVSATRAERDVYFSRPAPTDAGVQDAAPRAQI
ncbi:glutathione S-transferase family protein [Sphingosinicella soli]|uniref:GST-like protein n=1 Tax=Sphingosinicella soli TaxID=333708 RepID=A0A7W7B174_9SPHN|nr:glutathione S-transferase N-terminal domain-containing protein [Sphingosinicella soli]MBB4631994.1 GST-like protein [Sphingosinicella soli]